MLNGSQETIRQLLVDGNSATALIAAGHPKSTVYKMATMLREEQGIEVVWRRHAKQLRQTVTALIDVLEDFAADLEEMAP